jgi:hypothetical protein
LFEGSASFITVHEQFRHKFKLFLILSNFWEIIYYLCLNFTNYYKD